MLLPYKWGAKYIYLRYVLLLGNLYFCLRILQKNLKAARKRNAGNERHFCGCVWVHIDDHRTFKIYRVIVIIKNLESTKRQKENRFQSISDRCFYLINLKPFVSYLWKKEKVSDYLVGKLHETKFQTQMLKYWRCKSRYLIFRCWRVVTLFYRPHEKKRQRKKEE